MGAICKASNLNARKNPNAVIPISHAAKIKIAEEIRTLVNEYYGITIETAMLPFESRAYALERLEDSVAHSQWDTSFPGYNCYGFAIETYECIDPGYYHYRSETPQNGTEYAFDIYSIDIEEIRERVIKDLVANNKERVFFQPNEMNTNNLCINETIICVRKGPNDYHFMRYTPEGWLHKPGQTQILCYIGTPSYERVWTNEHIAYNEVNWIFNNIPDTEMTYYDSTIYFISYNGHNWTYTNNGNLTHTKSCSICDDAFEYNCNLSYPYIGDSMHNIFCSDCDYGISGAYCSYSYQANVNGTHRKTCTLSNHYEATETCTYRYTSNGNGRHTATCIFCGGSYEASCEMNYEYWMYNQHKGECSRCGYETAENCTAESTYCGNGSTQHIHANACRDCGNPMSSATSGCTFAYTFAGTVNGVNTHRQVCTACGYQQGSTSRCMYFKSNYCSFCGTHKDTVQAAAAEELNTKE